jgi:hypothetical protein
MGPNFIPMTARMNFELIVLWKFDYGKGTIYPKKRAIHSLYEKEILVDYRYD